MTGIPGPALIVSGDGVILAVNDEAAALLGAAAGRRLDEFVHEASRDAARRVASGVAERAEIVTANGREVALSVGMMDQGGRLALLRDLGTERRRERALVAEREALEKSMRAKSRFFAAASHDLRQPLQALALFVSALGPHVKGGSGETILQSIKVSLRAMEDMFDSLLDMSRLDAGVLKPQPEMFLIGDVLEELEGEFRPQCEARHLALRVAPSSAAVFTDRRLVSRILRNFMANAVRYTVKGGILLGCRRRGDSLRIEVWDTGPGIPEHQRLAIFDEFFRGEGSGDAGVGLGLAIVQRLAGLLGHRLDVRSAPERGSVFAVEVPLADADLNAGDDPGEEGGEPDVRGLTVMIVEDDPDVLDGLVMALGEWGCRAVGAATLEEALQILGGGVRPDAILADLHLRHQNCGIRAVEAIHEALGAAVPAFVLTGDTDPRSGNGLPYPVLRKPLDPTRLRLVLAEACGR